MLGTAWLMLHIASARVCSSGKQGGIVTEIGRGKELAEREAKV